MHIMVLIFIDRQIGHSLKIYAVEVSNPRVLYYDDTDVKRAEDFRDVFCHAEAIIKVERPADSSNKRGRVV